MYKTGKDINKQTCTTSAGISPWWSLQEVSSLKNAHTPLLPFVNKQNILKRRPWVSHVPGKETSF